MDQDLTNSQAFLDASWPRSEAVLGNKFSRKATPLETILFSAGCTLFPQKEKKRLVKARPLVFKKPYVFSAIQTFDSGVSLRTLPDGFAVVDIDNSVLAKMFLAWFMQPEHGLKLLVLTTTRGFHVYGRVGKHVSLPKTPHCHLRCGFEAEVFSNQTPTAQITVHAPNRELLSPAYELSELSDFPTFLDPVRKVKSFDALTESIPEGTRWNTLSRMVYKFPHLNAETLRFLCDFGCTPPYDEEDKISTWMAFIAERQGQIEPSPAPDDVSRKGRRMKC